MSQSGHSVSWVSDSALFCQSHSSPYIGRTSRYLIHGCSRVANGYRFLSSNTFCHLKVSPRIHLFANALSRMHTRTLRHTSQCSWTYTCAGVSHIHLSFCLKAHCSQQVTDRFSLFSSCFSQIFNSFLTTCGRTNLDLAFGTAFAWLTIHAWFSQ